MKESGREENILETQNNKINLNINKCDQIYEEIQYRRILRIKMLKV